MLTHSRLKLALIKHNHELIKSLPLSASQTSTTFKKLQFERMYLGVEKKKEPIALVVAHSWFTKAKGDGYPRIALQAKNILLKKQIPTDFIMTYLYESSLGEQITFKGSMDYFDFINKYKGELNFKQYLNMLGQVCLAVYDLHSRNVVHRDIKPENFLVFEGILKLADLDTIQEVNSSGEGRGEFFIAGTNGFMPREALSSDANLKAIDCYALGVTLKEAYRLLSADTTYDERLLITNLSKSLTKIIADRRITIKQVLENPVFGKTKEDRDVFFANLRETARKNAFKINGIPVTPRQLDDASLVVQDFSVRKIYQTAWNLAEKIEEKPILPTLSVSLAYVTWLRNEAEKINKMLFEAKVEKSFSVDISDAIASDLLKFPAPKMEEKKEIPLPPLPPSPKSGLGCVIL